MDNKYHPLTEQEFIELRDLIKGMGAYLPENKAPYVWDKFNYLSGGNEPRPCTCASAGAHWKRAVDFLFNWIKERE
jgi:hypothetical protein